ncbi:hypothetical protein C8R45DRAFT_1219250 [Mycena sanguinolenta]|nr:hypothetical protein C8R45DRAFT_1219250 [Mycena sanguinolenta]
MRPHNKKLTLGYMRAHQPFETLPEEYFACAMPHKPKPPLFLYGFAFPFCGAFTTSVEMLRGMQCKIPPKFGWSDPQKYRSIDAICKYVEARIESTAEFRIRRSLVDCNLDTLFVFYIYSSWMPRQPMAPEWVARLAEVSEDLGWIAPEPKWHKPLALSPEVPPSWCATFKGDHVRIESNMVTSDPREWPYTGVNLCTHSPTPARSCSRVAQCRHPLARPADTLLPLLPHPALVPHAALSPLSPYHASSTVATTPPFLVPDCADADCAARDGTRYTVGNTHADVQTVIYFAFATSHISCMRVQRLHGFYDVRTCGSLARTFFIQEAN